MKALKYILGMAWMVYAVYAVFFESSVEGVIMATLVAGGMHDTELAQYRIGISRKTQLVVWDKSFWAPMMGFVGGRKNMFDEAATYAKTALKPSATGMPIEVHQDFRNGGGEIEVPVFYPLTQLGVSGGETLKGTGEKARLAAMKVPVNQKRKAFLQQDNKMSRQIWTSKEIRMQLYDRSQEYLGDWATRYLAYQPYMALLQGYSENITATKGGIGKQIQSHMNFYVAGAGRVSFSTTHATYEGNVVTALDAMTSNNVFNTEFIHNLVYEASHTHKIQPVKINGVEVYPLLISDSQARQLRNDTVWQDRVINAGVADFLKNPIFTGKVLDIYEGALLLIDKTIPSVRTDSTPNDTDFSTTRSTTGTTGGVCYGTEDANSVPDFLENTVDSGDLKPAILLGQSAIQCGIAEDINYDEEVDDFKQRIEVGCGFIYGMQCADIYDMDATFGTAGNKRYENRSSLVGVTHSPSASTWS